MTRPTIEGLGHATDCLEHLGWRCTARNANGFHQVKDLLDMLTYFDSELEIHRNGSVYGAGTDTHTIGRHGLNRPVESRLDWGSEDPNSKHQRGGPAQPPVEPADPVYRELRKLQRDLLSTLTSLNAQYQHRANQVAGWPHRSEVG